MRGPRGSGREWAFSHSGGLPRRRLYARVQLFWLGVLCDPVIDGVQLDLLWCGPDAEHQRTIERLIADVRLNPVRAGGLDQIASVDVMVGLWFALAIGQKHGRHLGFKVLIPHQT